MNWSYTKFYTILLCMPLLHTSKKFMIGLPGKAIREATGITKVHELSLCLKAKKMPNFNKQFMDALIVIVLSHLVLQPS